MSGLIVFLLIVLGIIALIDWKFKEVPSIFLTGILLVALIVPLQNLNIGLNHMMFGILALVYGWMLYEANFVGGVADIKVIAIMGSVVGSLKMFLIMMALIVIFGIAYKMVFKYILKRDESEEIPFIPALYTVFIAMMIIGGLLL